MEGFDKFWQAYPRRVAKGAARKAWAAAIKRVPDLLERCLRTLAWQIPANGWDGGHYTPHPSTYLNQERYDDEDPQAVERARRAVQEAADAEWRERRKRLEAEAMARGER